MIIEIQINACTLFKGTIKLNLWYSSESREFYVTANSYQNLLKKLEAKNTKPSLNNRYFGGGIVAHYIQDVLEDLEEQGLLSWEEAAEFESSFENLDSAMTIISKKFDNWLSD